MRPPPRDQQDIATLWATAGNDDAFCPFRWYVQHRNDGVGTVVEIGACRLGKPQSAVVQVLGAKFEDALRLVWRRQLLIEREHLVALGFAPPELDQLCHLVGLVPGAIVAFREVLVEVIKLPLVGIEVSVV